jgi:hypothetical protein
MGLPYMQKDLLLHLQDLREQPRALQGVSEKSEKAGRCGQVGRCWRRSGPGRSRVMEERLTRRLPRHLFRCCKNRTEVRVVSLVLCSSW